MKGKRRWMTLLTVVILAVAAYLIVRVLGRFSVQEVQESLTRLDAGRLVLASLCVAGSYATLTGFDWLGVRHARRVLPYPKVALASFTALSIGHTVGLSPLSSGGVRYRFYTRWGLRLPDVATIILSSAITVSVGELALASVAVLVRPDLAARLLHIDPLLARLAGGTGILLLGGYVLLAARVRGRITIRQWSISLPNWRIALAQIVVGTVNFAFVTAALHQALASTASIDWLTVATAFLLGNMVALISHVPGGAGVIESVIVMLFPDADVIGPLIAFRVLYYLVPLTIGVVLFATIEIALRLRRDGARVDGGADAASRRTM